MPPDGAGAAGLLLILLLLQLVDLGVLLLFLSLPAGRVLADHVRPAADHGGPGEWSPASEHSRSFLSR